MGMARFWLRSTSAFRELMLFPGYRGLRRSRIGSSGGAFDHFEDGTVDLLKVGDDVEEVPRLENGGMKEMLIGEGGAGAG